MNRQDLAMKLFVNNGWSPTEAFTLADMFIAECESQKREPKACEKTTCGHPLSNYEAIGDNDFFVCRKCWPKGTTIITPEPPKPELAAREWEIKYMGDGFVSCKLMRGAIQTEEYRTPIRVREILPGEER